MKDEEAEDGLIFILIFELLHFKSDTQSDIDRQGPPRVYINKKGAQEI